MEFIDIPLAGGFIQALLPMIAKFLPQIMAKGVLAGKGGMDVTNIVKMIGAGKGGGQGITKLMESGAGGAGVKALLESGVGGAGGAGGGGGQQPNIPDIRTGHEYIAELAKARKEKKDPVQAYLDRKSKKDTKQYG